MNTTDAATTWWGEHTLALGGTGSWRVGAFGLRAHRTTREWFLQHESSGDELDARLAIEVPAHEPIQPASEDTLRFAFDHAPETIRITPALADRPVVFSALTPFRVPPGEDVMLYFSSSIWITVRIGASDAVLLDVPAQRPSDTWFGPNTRTGELCYASRTRARTTLDATPSVPHRAVSSVHIQNRGRSPLPIERIKLPMQTLSLYGTPDGHLLTEKVTLRRSVDGDFAELRHSGHPPEQVEGAARITGPRGRTERGLVHAFGRLFDV